MSVVTVAAVLGLAVLDMLSPAVVGVTLYVLLARPNRLVRLLGVYLGTVAVAYFALGVLLMLGLAAVVPAIDPGVRMWAQAAIGVALFAGSWFIPGKKHQDHAQPRTRQLTVRSMALLGLGTWLFEFYTAIPFFAATAIMTTAGLAPAAWAPLLACYVLIMILPGITLYAAWTLLRDRMHTRFERWQHKFANGSRKTLSWIMGTAGVLITLDALPNDLTITIP